VIVVDTSVPWRDGRHRAARDWYESFTEELATTPLVLAEIDHLVAARAGSAGLPAFRADAAGGAYSIEWWRAATAQSVEVAGRYGGPGL